jgi:hypothetical protein
MAKVETRFSTLSLWHASHATASPHERTYRSKGRWQSRQTYSYSGTASGL